MKNIEIEKNMTLNALVSKKVRIFAPCLQSK